MKLRKVESVELIPTSPFDFDSTFHKPDHFTSGDNHWEPGIRWQTWYWQGKQLGLKFSNGGSRDKPKIKLNIYYKNRLDKDFLESLIEEVRYRYNLDLGLSDGISLATSHRGNKRSTQRSFSTKTRKPLFRLKSC